MFPRAQLGRRFRAAAPESGPQPVGAVARALLGGSRWTCAPRKEAHGRKKEITGGGFESSNCFKLGLKEQVGISDRAGEREREFQTEEIALTKLWRHERVC